MQVLSPLTGLLILLIFGAASYGITALVERHRRTNTTQAFLVADRKVGWIPNGLSIAATWIWAPALFVAAEQGYKNGWVGVFWFTVPNVACLVIFAFFAHMMRRKYPTGFTLAGFMRDHYSRRVRRVYQGMLVGLAIASFAVQLLAGGLVVATLTGINFLWVTVVLALIALSYSLKSGLGASIITDYLQMGLIAVVGLVLAPWVVASAGVDVTLDGMAGFSGVYTSLTSGPGAAVFWSFGLSTSIGLLSGPFGDQSFWQRAFASKEEDTRKAFIFGAAVFAIVPLTMSLLGFALAGSGKDLGKDTQLVNLHAVMNWLPEWTVIPFMFFVLSGLVSTLDSNLASIGSLAGDEAAHRNAGSKVVLKEARWAMIGLTVAGLLLANIPGLTITALFIFYGTVRACTLLPTVLALLGPRSERGMFYGPLAAAVFGLPISAYGNLNNVTEAKVIGSLLVLAISGGVVWAFTALDRIRDKQDSADVAAFRSSQEARKAPKLVLSGPMLFPAPDKVDPLVLEYTDYISRSVADGASEDDLLNFSQWRKVKDL